MDQPPTSKNVPDEIYKMTVEELASAYVHGNAELFHFLPESPCRELSTGCLQHPSAKLNNQTALFGQGNKFSGWNHASPEMPPAQQRFGADNAPDVVDLRLIMQLELFVLHGSAQIRLQFSTR